MIIRNNKNATFAYRSLGTSRSALAKSLEKLSSGYAINRAADDAAGLAISEKMRRLITGLGQAHQNSKDGASLIQVGEGALDEIHGMLNRMVELAEQSANGTYVDELDRKGLQAELDQLCDDIDRIARSTNFNSIKLFQDKGLEYEQAKEAATSALHTQQQAAEVNQDAAQNVPQRTPDAPRRTLDELLRDEDKGDLNIVYIEDPVITNQTGFSDSAAGIVNDPTQDITIGGKKISEILKTEIVPQTVKNILTNYPAFSYLKDSAIGIGMKLYSDPDSSVLASVTLGSSLYANGTGTLGYMLSVNMGKVNTSDTKWREDLEATIAHEMIHAFMDEATTAGMTGKLPGSGSLQDVGRFEKWFIEGMAQTASGPDNWIYPKGYTGGGLQIDTTSTDAEIKAQISQHRLINTDTDSSVNYGTGYLACMYLGWAIASGGDTSTAVNAANISGGLSSLLNEVIGGSSLDAAIKKLTNDKFASTADFKSKFNTAGTEVTGFIHNLMVAKDSGRGGLASGDLKANDLTDNAELTGVTLFQLNTNTPMVNNKYPDDYVILTGGTTSKDGVKPSDFAPAATQQEYGDFVIKGALSDGSGGLQGITWDDTTKTLTVATGKDIEITMKSPTSGTLQNLILNGTGKVTLNGVQAASLEAKEDTEISFKAKNDISTVTVDSGKTANFKGEGQLKVGTSFTNNGTVSFDGGAVIVGGGTGAIGGTVKVNGASVAADITTPTAPDGTTALKPISVDWTKLTGLSDIASITIDGVKSDAILSGSSEPGKLWLDPTSSHRVTFTNASGVSKTLAAKLNAAGTDLEWVEPVKPFTVTGGTEGTDYHYEDDGTTLVIDTDQVTSISGGTVTAEAGNTLQGRIKLKDNIGNDVNLTLDGVNCGGNTVGSGLDLGVGNTVTLTLADGKDNKFTGAANFAGVAVGQGTNLTIKGDTGTLDAKGGTNAAGVGANYNTALKDATAQQNSITIDGGVIKATGGSQGAGIGGANSTAFGSIYINGGTITSLGNSNSAGIGGGAHGDICDIIIKDGEIDTRASACVGIGTGVGAYGNGIRISGGKIYSKGGAEAGGIGPDLDGTMEFIEITGGDITAVSGTNGSGIGGGANSHIGSITISGDDTVVKASGGANGVAIGSGRRGSTCDKIHIKGGTITAEGAKDSTGIGAGRDSTCGEIIIGDESNPNSKIIITAQGGMTYNGGNIMTYTDKDHTKPGKVTITGQNTTVRPGAEGEGLYSTSGVVGTDGKPLYAYPVYLFHTGSGGKDDTLNAGVGLNAAMKTANKLPLDSTKVDPASITISSSTGGSWKTGLNHGDLDSDYVFLWLKPEDQKLTIQYEEDDGTGNKVGKSLELDLIWKPKSGVFRIDGQPEPQEAVKPGYSDDPEPDPPTPPEPEPPTPPEPNPELVPGGIILQIGAEYGETLTVPQFYLSRGALNLGDLDISTQDNAWESMPIIRDAINRVSSIRGTYGALYNRLEHNQRQLQHMVENTTDAESRIRDLDVAQEMMVYTKNNILLQSSQAMLAQANQLPQGVLQLMN